MILTKTEWTVTPAELRALLAHASTDETRPHLASVALVRKTGHVATTDGHRLLAWTGEKCEAPTRLLSAALLSKLVAFAEKARPARRRRVGPEIPGVTGAFTFKLGANGATTTARGVTFVFPYVKAEYPPIEQVIPRYKKGAASSVFAIQPKFFAALLLATRVDGRRYDGITLQGGPNALDPILVRFENAAWLAVLMPMRFGDTWDADGKPGQK